MFQLRLSMNSDYQNVIYFNQVAFLMQRLDVKVELAHVMLIYAFAKNVSKIFDKNLVGQHAIF